jgi:flagellin
MTNQMLNTATKAASALTELKNANAESLEILGTDKVSVSYTHQGKTYSTVLTVGSYKMSDLATKVLAAGTKAGDNGAGFQFTDAISVIGTAASGATVYTANGSSAISLQATQNGVAGQIAGFSIRITDKEGNVKKSANAALDAFTEQIKAQNASEDNALTFQVGAKANQSIKVGLGDMRSEALGLKGSDGTKLNISTQEKANAAINVLDNAVQKALDQQTTIGSIESRLSYTSTNLTTASENVQASESTIRDADMAKEMTNYTKNNVLLQAAQSMLAQANQSSSSVLSLLQ